MRICHIGIMHVLSILVISLVVSSTLTQSNFNFKAFSPTQLVNCTLLIKKINFDHNKSAVSINTSIGTTPDGFSSLSIDIYIRQKTSNNIEIKSELIELSRGRNLTLLTIPPFDYCRMKEMGDRIPWVLKFMSELKRFGNTVQSCPLEIGHYYLKDGYFNDTGVSLKTIAKLNQPYLFTVLARDVSRRNKAIFYFKMELVASYIE
jgi:Protein of unknown function (DUF1091)